MNKYLRNTNSNVKETSQGRLNQRGERANEHEFINSSYKDHYQNTST